METLYFHLNSPNSCYFPGELITGQLTLQSLKEIDAKKFELILVGEVRTCLDRHNGKKPTSISTPDSTFIFIKQQLWHSSEDDPILPNGDSKFGFSIMLPEKALASYQNQHAKIKYELMAKLNKGESQKIWTFPVFILPKLCPQTSLEQPLMFENLVENRILCCGTGFLEYKATLNKSEYAPNEPLFLSLELQNHLNSSIQLIQLLFLQHEILSAKQTKNLQKFTKSLRLTTEPFDLKKNETGMWKKSVKLPCIFPSIYGNLEAVRLEYELKVELMVNSSCSIFGQNIINIDLPIKIVNKRPDRVLMATTSSLIPYTPARKNSSMYGLVLIIATIVFILFVIIVVVIVVAATYEPKGDTRFVDY